MQRPLVGLDCQEKVGALLLEVLKTVGLSLLNGQVAKPPA